MVSSSVLVLNKSFLPVHVTSLKRALILLYQDIAKAVDENYRTFSFDSWRELSVTEKTNSIGLVGRARKNLASPDALIFLWTMLKAKVLSS